MMNFIWMTFGLKLTSKVLLVMFLTACVQDIRVYIPRYADKSTLSVSDDTLKTVNRTFYASFVAGNWYYKGAQVTHNGVSAYIQIPQKLDMKQDVQERYLREAICPKADKIELWNQLKHTNLSVHIYTSNKANSVSATCDNPWLESQYKNTGLFAKN